MFTSALPAPGGVNPVMVTLLPPTVVSPLGSTFWMVGMVTYVNWSTDPMMLVPRGRHRDVDGPDPGR